MSLDVINTEYASGMTVRERLRAVLVERMLKQVVASQANETNVLPTAAMQPSDKDSTGCSEAEAPAKKRKLNTNKLKCSIISCDESFYKMRQVIEHLNEMHNQNLKVEHLTFSAETEFDEWIRNVERSALCNFLRRYITNRPSVVHSYYYCSRSGSSRIITEPRKRHLKVQGYNKINRTCPAHIIKHVTHDGISVDYYPTHLCHADRYEQLGHLGFSVADRTWLAGKLALQIPLEAILRDVRNTLDGQLTRLHILTKKDLSNIEQAFHLNKPERQHKDDATSVTAFVHSYDDKDNSPILAYKQQGAGHFDILPEGVNASMATEDFFFAMMDGVQCQMLQTEGNGDMSVICIDSTHGTNSYDFQLTTVMVLDSNRQWFPAAFLYSNRLTEETFKVFFEALKAKCGIIQCNAFMSDMAPQFYNAWKVVMGECPHRLYCAWHVDKSFRENCRRLIKDSEKVVLVYKTLRTLMDEQDAVTFDTSLPTFISQLRNDPDTASFMKFFEAHYATCINSWAYSYRAKCGINTNMHLERMHGILKHIYLHGKKNKRLDSAIASLINLVYDKQFDRLTAICKGKYTKKLSELRKRHAASVTMKSISCEMIPGKEWCVRSQSEETNYYTVHLANTECECSIKCGDCDACIHRYSCNCQDNQTFFNMCKHIHYIGMLNVHMKPQKTKALVLTQKSADSDNADSDQFQIDTTDGIHLRHECEAGAHVQQLSRPTTELEERRKQLEQHNLETSLIIKSLTALEEMDVVDTTLCSIKPKLTAVRAKRASTSLIPNADRCKEPSNKNVEKQQRFFSTKRRAPSASSSVLAKPTNEERKKIELELLKTKLINNASASVSCVDELQLQK